MVTRRVLGCWFERAEERKATGKRFFFCRQEALQTVIDLCEVQSRREMPETGYLLRYACKLAEVTVFVNEIRRLDVSDCDSADKLRPR